MARSRKIFLCRQCGAEFPKWMGRCPECGEWNTVEEDLSAYGPSVVRLHHGPGGEDSGQSRPLLEAAQAEEPLRMATGLPELERVLGGTLPAGAVILLGGDPGIGKSTLVLQLLSGLGAAGYQALYISGEESASQIKLRAQRLGCPVEGVSLLAEVDLERMLAEIQRARPRLVVVDSIQTVRSGQLDAATGNVSQVRACAASLIEAAKRLDVALVLVGHVTREGTLAGPRSLEHMVDVVLYLEGLEERPQRLLRSVKNRFGSSNEVGLFEMTPRGLATLENPSSLFLGQRNSSAPGTVVFPGIEGTRPLLVEIQALVGENSTATPRRTAVGVEPNRVAMLQAVIEKHLGDVLSGLDIYLNVVGGLRLSEPAVDAAVVAALLSSFRNRPIDHDTVVLGEVGLTGELRPVRFMQERLAEAARLGFKKALLPEAGPAAPDNRPPPGLEADRVKNVTQLAAALFDS
ncbi:MAG: DNA repair protein RadA [Deltaproteobacteria bacterium]|nr:DNA repair protein RadA [Deltaproteobacteria bacterium]